MSAEPRIRRQLRPGDLGAIVAAHGRIYGREFGLDSTFEAHVATSIANAGRRGWPGPREAVWIAELDGGYGGSIALTDEGDGEATLRWVLLDPALRGRGLGARLVGEALAEADRHGYELVSLETFSDLTTAARIYRSQGFEVVWSQTGPRWGRDEITYQRYELELARWRFAQARSSRSAGSSERPFSVSA